MTLGPLTIAEQVIFLQALHELGEFDNQAIRDKNNGYLPRRLSDDISSYWAAHALRLQQIIFDKYQANDSTRFACFGIDNPAFGTFFKQQKLSNEDAEEIIAKLQQWKAMGKQDEKAEPKLGQVK